MTEKPLFIIVFLAFFGGCFLFNGSLFRNPEKVLLIKDNPNYYAKDSKEEPGEILGKLPQHAGDTISSIGYYSGGITAYGSYLILFNQKEVYMNRADVLSQDDMLYRRLGSRFKWKISEDEWIWPRATDYIKSHTKAPIEIANENLIKTKTIQDTTALGFIVTRVVERNHVEYEIICKSYLNGPDPNEAGNLMAFYMATGRDYHH